MKKQYFLFSLFIILALCLSAFCNAPVFADGEDKWPQEPEVFSESAVLMEANTGTILYAKNAEETLYPASITKILTVLLALENGKMDDPITFSYDAFHKTEGTRIGLDVGETISLESCIYGVMLGSDNECAYALAEYIGGTYDKFIEMMNERIKKIGCVNTHFTNPHGLPDDNHYTCAYDMALITQEAMKNATFRKIFSTKQYTIPATNKADSRLVNNHHYMVLDKDANYHYDGVTGGKNGYTSKALNTLVTTATRENMDLICVVMKTSTTHYSDSRNLLNYGFQNFSPVNISENEKNINQDTEEFLRIGEDLAGNSTYILQFSDEDSVILPNGVDFSLAEPSFEYTNLDAGTIVRLTYHLGSHEIGGTNIHFAETIDAEKIFAPVEKTKTVKKERPVLKINIGKILLVSVCILCAAAVVFLLIHFRKALNLSRFFRKLKRLRKKKYPSEFENYKF